MAVAVVVLATAVAVAVAGYYQGSNNGQGNGRMRRRRHYHDRQDRPPFGGEAAPDAIVPRSASAADPGRRRPAAADPGRSVPISASSPPTEIPLEPGYGLLEMHPNGYGFLRSPDNTYTRERSDPFVPGTMIEKYGLRQGVMIRGTVQPARRQQGPRLREITDVDGMPPDEYINVKNFDAKTPINPDKWFKLETGPAAADDAGARPAHTAWPRTAPR